jgi:hypothetical protein
MTDIIDFPATDPVLGLIAESERLDRLATPIRARADQIMFALGDEVTEGAIEGEGTAAAPLYREAEAIEARRDELSERVASTKATTIGGVIAQLRFLLDPSTEGVEIIVAGLRDIEQRLAGAR